jgi:hypothetical protein
MKRYRRFRSKSNKEGAESILQQNATGHNNHSSGSGEASKTSAGTNVKIALWR